MGATRDSGVERRWSGRLGPFLQLAAIVVIVGGFLFLAYVALF